MIEVTSWACLSVFCKYQHHTTMLDICEKYTELALYLLYVDNFTLHIISIQLCLIYNLISTFLFQINIILSIIDSSIITNNNELHFYEMLIVIYGLNLHVHSIITLL